MSKIQEMIDRMCPEGVLFRKIKDIAEVGTGSSNRDEAVDNGQYPFYVRSKEVFKKNSFEFNEEAIIIPGEGGIGEIFHYANGKYALHQRAYRIHFLDSAILTKFALYYFSQAFKGFIQQKAVSATVTSIRKPMIEDFEIPIPPLPVQEEIVRVLDTFTELQAELQAELQKRLQQYEYYKTQVFQTCSCPVQYSIDEICTKVTDGSHFSPASIEKGYYMPSVKDMLPNGFDFSSCKQIGEDDYNQLVRNGCQPKVNDILIAKDGSMLKYAFPVKEEMPIVVLSSIAILSVNTTIVNPAFLAYYFKQEAFKEAVIREQSTKGGVPRIVLKNFKKIKVSIPSLAEQKRIVAILDRFDALTRDLTSGLPAEIEKRRQQYEYYRDKLLTFKRAV